VRIITSVNAHWPVVNAEIGLLTYCECGWGCGSIRRTVGTTDSYLSAADSFQSTATSGVEEAVKQFAVRCRETVPPSRRELEEALDQGLGRLFLLEGWLRDSQQRGVSADEQDDHCQAKHEDLLMKVSTLRSAVQDLRSLLTPCDSPLAYGFVNARVA
jgi:hypothetical protein